MSNGYKIVNKQSSKNHSKCNVSNRGIAHIEAACSRARGVLSFLGRNLKIANTKTKELAYFALVRPHVEYCSTVWDPYTKKMCNRVEMVQRRAARFVSNKFGRGHYKDSVTEMLNNLKLVPLSERIKQFRLSMLYNLKLFCKHKHLHIMVNKMK